MAEEEYYQSLKKQGVNDVFRKTELEKLSSLAKEDPLIQTFYATRSNRIQKPTIPQGQMTLASRATSSAPKSAGSKAPPSAKATSVVPSSRREIRTGGFTKLGSEIMGN